MMTSRIRKALTAAAFLAVAAVTPLAISQAHSGDTGWTTSAATTHGTPATSSTTAGDTGWSTPTDDTGWAKPGATVDSLDTGW